MMTRSTGLSENGSASHKKNPLFGVNNGVSVRRCEPCLLLAVRVGCYRKGLFGMLPEVLVPLTVRIVVVSLDICRATSGVKIRGCPEDFRVTGSTILRAGVGCWMLRVRAERRLATG
jgi:hypothetical protein